LKSFTQCEVIRLTCLLSCLLLDSTLASSATDSHLSLLFSSCLHLCISGSSSLGFVTIRLAYCVEQSASERNEYGPISRCLTLSTFHFTFGLFNEGASSPYDIASNASVIKERWIERSCCVRVVAQAVSCLLPTAAARVRARVRSCGICGGQSCTVTGFIRVLRFPLQIISPTASHSSSSSSSLSSGYKNIQ
jgi:hypothetical protein